MSALYLYDDAAARVFEPFSLSRPAGELRAGAELIRRRWEEALGMPVSGYLTAPHLHNFTELDAPTAAVPLVLAAGSIVANARCAPALGRVADGQAWRCHDRWAAVRLTGPVPLEHFARGAHSLESLSPPTAAVTMDGWWIDHVWDLLRHLPEMLARDIRALATDISSVAPDGVTVIGDKSAVFIEEGAKLEPLVVVDTTGGPVMVRRGASVAAFTRLVGPCFIGFESHVLGGRVTGCAVGEVCRVHGEVSNTIFLGHANKGHDGFVGHSILGRWSNLGASTVTSNLKNTYGAVQLWTPTGQRDTGMQFLGTLLGDHAKTAVGTRLMTGTVVGTAANVVADGLPPKVVAPFAFGDTVYRLDKFLEVAERVMGRRHVALGAAGRAWLTDVYHARWASGA